MLAAQSAPPRAVTARVARRAYWARLLPPLAVLAQLLTAVLLASLARRRWGDTAGRTAGVLYLLVSVGLNPEDAQAATFEVFMLPWTAAALWCADRGRWGAAGAAVAAAYASVTGSELHVLARALTNAAILAVASAGLLPPVVRALRCVRAGAAE